MSTVNCQEFGNGGCESVTKDMGVGGKGERERER